MGRAWRKQSANQTKVTFISREDDFVCQAVEDILPRNHYSLRSEVLILKKVILLGRKRAEILTNLQSSSKTPQLPRKEWKLRMRRAEGGKREFGDT